MTFALSKRSLSKLEGVHPDLVKTVKRAISITSVDFAVTEGLRGVTRQKELVAKGLSQTMRSRHLTGHAVDLAAIVGGTVNWDWEHYEKIADAMLTAGAELGVPITWGGLWTTLKDGPHFELHRGKYP